MTVICRLSLKAGTGNLGTKRGMPRGTRKTGTRKAGIFFNRNVKRRYLFQQEREKLESLKTGTGKAGIFRNRNAKIWCMH
jgi:hypothetical protein